jgi:SAM-dependent methyltransferase
MTAAEPSRVDEPVGALAFIDVAWLDDHHQAKQPERQAMVEALDLQPGETVVDVGCGPGYWSEMFAEKVGPAGRVVGVDLSPELIRHARSRRGGGSFDDVLTYREGGFDALPVADGAASTVFFGNCLTYVTDVDRVFAELRRIARPGGRIAVKDFDGGVLVVHPLDRALTYRVLAATDRALTETPPDPPFDNYAGRGVDAACRPPGGDHTLPRRPFHRAAHAGGRALHPRQRRVVRADRGPVPRRARPGGVVGGLRSGLGGRRPRPSRRLLLHAGSRLGRPRRRMTPAPGRGIVPACAGAGAPAPS